MQEGSSILSSFGIIDNAIYEATRKDPDHALERVRTTSTGEDEDEGWATDRDILSSEALRESRKSEMMAEGGTTHLFGRYWSFSSSDGRGPSNNKHCKGKYGRNGHQLSLAVSGKKNKLTTILYSESISARVGQRRLVAINGSQSGPRFLPLSFLTAPTAQTGRH